MLVAVAHLVGPFIAWLVYWVFVAWFNDWATEKHKRGSLEDAAWSLGITCEELESEEHVPRIIEYLAARYSPELFRNRLSDLCGAVRFTWEALGLLAQVAILGAAVWNTVSSDSADAVNAWFVLPVAVGFSAVSIAFAFACKFFTGRYPGEAKSARKAQLETLHHRRERSVARQRAVVE